MSASLGVYRGNALPITLNLKDDTGAIFDLTGYSAKVKAVWGDYAAERHNGCCRSECIDSPTIDTDAGTITGSFTGTQTCKFPVNEKAKLYLELTQPDTTVKTYRLGRIQAHEE